MKYSTLAELRILNQITETNVSQVTQTLNQNFEKGLISEELCENSFKELDNLIEKAGNHKYFKREGSPGNYKYYYTEAEYKQAKGGESSSKKKKVGDIHEYDGKKYKKIAEGKWLEVSEHGMTKKEHNNQLVDMKQAGPSISRRLDDEWEKHASAREGLSDKEHSDEEVGLGSKSEKKSEKKDISKFDWNSVSAQILNRFFGVTKDNLKVEGFLFLGESPITSLPDNLEVESHLGLYGTRITSLPNGLKVGGDLDLRKTKITSLPDDLEVGGDLDLRKTKITQEDIKPSMKIKGKIYF